MNAVDRQEWAEIEREEAHDRREAEQRAQRYTCPDCGGGYDSHAALCPNAPDEELAP